MLRRLIDKIYRKDEKAKAESQEAEGAGDKARPEAQSGAAPVVASPAAQSDSDPGPKDDGGQGPDGEARQAGPEDAEALRDRVIENLKKVYDPEIPVNIYELGLIYEVRPEASGMVYVKMTLTAPNCPAAGILPGQVESQARAAEGVRDVTLDLVFDPPWTPERMSEAAKLELGML